MVSKTQERERDYDGDVLYYKMQFLVARWLAALAETEARQWEGWPWGVFWPQPIKGMHVVVKDDD